jgi:hypothetical protein
MCQYLVNTQPVGWFGESIMSSRIEFAPHQSGSEIGSIYRALIPEGFTTNLCHHSPVLEDLAVAVAESIPAEQVTRIIHQAAGDRYRFACSMFFGDQAGLV